MNIRSNIRRALSLMIVVMMVASPLFVLSGSSSTNFEERTNGNPDMDIGSGQIFIIDENTIDPITGQRGMYGQDGNITVESGGTLIVRNATLYFIQDNGNDGIEGTADDHHYWLRVESGGKFIMDNATMKTVDWAVNPYVRFNTIINGKAEFMDNSTISYPGNFTVDNGILYVNNSVFEGLKDLSDDMNTDENNHCPFMSFINSYTVFSDSKIKNYYNVTQEPITLNFHPSQSSGTGSGTVNDLRYNDGSYYQVAPGETLVINAFDSDQPYPEGVSNSSEIEQGSVSIYWAANETYNGTGDFYINGQDTMKAPSGDAGSVTINGLVQDYGIATLGDLESMRLNFTHDGTDGTIPFDMVSASVTLANPPNLVNITVDGGHFYAINTYMDVDFRENTSQLSHVAFLAHNGAEVRLYNVTVHELSDGTHPNFAFRPDSTSTVYLYGWLSLRSTDSNGTAVPYCRATSTFFSTNDSWVGRVDENNTLRNGDPVLTYLNRIETDRTVDENNYNVTDANGKGMIPLLKNIITSEDLNGVFVGNYLTRVHESVHGTNLTKQVNFGAYPDITWQDNSFSSNFSFSWEYPPRDLVVDTYTVEPTPVVRDDRVYVNATIANIGGINVTQPFNVSLMVDGSVVDTVPVDQPVIRNGGTVDVSLSWQTQLGDFGVHNLTIAVDPEKKICDGNRSNNDLSFNLDVEALYDLSVEPAGIWWENTTYGDNYTHINLTVHAEIYNIGHGDIPAGSTVDFYVDGNMIGSETLDAIAFGGNTIATAMFTTDTPGNYNVSVTVATPPGISDDNETNNHAYRVLSTKATPDLIISGIAFAPSLTDTVESFDTNITATVDVLDTYANGTIRVDFYDDTTGQSIGYSTYTGNVSAGDSVDISITWNAKRPVDATHTIRAVVSFTPAGSSPPETRTDNNDNTADVLVHPYIDLSISDSDITVTPANPYTYQEITVNATVHNSGNESISDFTVYIRVSGEPEYSETISYLAPGSEANLQYSFNKTSEGDYTIQVEISKVSGEVFTNNNVVEQVLTVMPTPDLTISSLRASSYMAVEFQNVTLTAAVDNVGETYANGTVTVDFYDDTVGRLVGSNSSAVFLLPGHVMNFTFVWDPEAPAGNHSFHAEVSFTPSSGAPPETCVDNNEISVKNLVYVQASIDLAISPADITYSPPAPLTYENVSITATIHNNGRRDIDRNITVEFLIGTDQYYRTVPGLAAGNSTNVTVQFFTTQPSNYTIMVIVDPEGLIPDYNTENNMASSWVFIGPRPELNLQSLDVLGEIGGEPAVVENHSIAIAAKIVNTGSSATGTVGVYFYDGNPDNGGVQIGYASYENPVSQGSKTLTIDWLAEGVGVHTIYARIVASTSPPEGNLNDNTRDTILTVLPRPDLTVTNITFMKGGNIINRTSQSRDFEVNVTIQNVGGSLADSRVNSFGITLFAGMPVPGNYSNELGNITVTNMTLMDLGAPVNFTFSIPAFTMEPGLLNVYAVVDFENVVDESSESNNTFNRTIDILQMHLSVSISTPSPGQSINMDEQSIITVTGRVIDEADGMPVSRIPMTVMFVDARNGEPGPQTSSVTWDNTGGFMATVNTPGSPGDYEIVISATVNGQSLTFQQSNVQFSVQHTPQESNLWWIIILIVVVVILGAVGGTLYYLKTHYAGKYVECGNCGKMIPAGSEKCPYCNAVFDKETVKCSSCGAWIPADAKECPKCGAKFLVSGKEIVDYETQMKQQYEAFVEKFRKQAKKEMGKDFTEDKFQQWWRTQKSFVTFEDWLKREEERKKTGGILCPHCGALNSKTDIVCHVCGTPLRATKKKSGDSNIDEASISSIELPSLDKKEESEAEETSEESEEEAEENAGESAEKEEKTQEAKPVVPVKKVVKKKVVKKAAAEPAKSDENAGESEPKELPPELIEDMKVNQEKESTGSDSSEDKEKPPEEKPPVVRKKVVKKVVKKKVVKK